MQPEQLRPIQALAVQHAVARKKVNRYDTFLELAIWMTHFANAWAALEAQFALAEGEWQLAPLRVRRERLLAPWTDLFRRIETYQYQLPQNSPRSSVSPNHPIWKRYNGVARPIPQIITTVGLPPNPPMH